MRVKWWCSLDMDSEGVESVNSMEDDIEDLEELEEEGEMSPEEVGIQRRLPKPVYPKRYVQPPSFLREPDVLGYLNTFKDLDDPERLRLSRACVNYLTARERQRNGYWLSRLEKKKQSSGGRKDIPQTRTLKRSRSMRATDLAEMVGNGEPTFASNNGEYPTYQNMYKDGDRLE